MHLDAAWNHRDKGSVLKPRASPIDPVLSSFIQFYPVFAIVHWFLVDDSSFFVEKNGVSLGFRPSREDRDPPATIASASGEMLPPWRWANDRFTVHLPWFILPHGSPWYIMCTSCVHNPQWSPGVIIGIFWTLVDWCWLFYLWGNMRVPEQSTDKWQILLHVAATALWGGKLPSARTVPNWNLLHDPRKKFLRIVG